MEDEYGNLNAQDLYDKFEKKYNENYFSADKKYLPNYWKWLINYLKLEVPIIALIVLLVTVVLYYLLNKPLLYRTIIFVFIMFIVLGFVADRFFSFSSIEKVLAESTIDEIFDEEKINLTEKNLKKIIKASRNVASREGNISREIKKIVVNSSSKAIVYSFFGVIVAYITFLNKKSSVEQFFKDLGPLFKLYFVIFVILAIISTFIYCLNKITNRRKDLYIEVLEDKRLSLLLRNNKSTDFFEEKINVQKNKEDIAQKQEDIRQEKENQSIRQLEDKKFTTLQNDKVNSNVLGAIGIAMIANKIFAIEKKRKDSRKRRR